MITIYHKPAVKTLEHLDSVTLKRIAAAVEMLPDGDVQPLMGRYPLLRLRVGNWRILFFYEDYETEESGTAVAAVITEIAPRGDVYKGARK
jgi:mRNA-degrading endonuclease RelE of RelBE toxin-antitoxin system